MEGSVYWPSTKSEFKDLMSQNLTLAEHTNHFNKKKLSCLLRLQTTLSLRKKWTSSSHLSAMNNT